VGAFRPVIDVVAASTRQQVCVRGRVNHAHLQIRQEEPLRLWSEPGNTGSVMAKSVMAKPKRRKFFMAGGFRAVSPLFHGLIVCARRPLNQGGKAPAVTGHPITCRFGRAFSEATQPFGCNARILLSLRVIRVIRKGPAGGKSGNFLLITGPPARTVRSRF
jgi:hypothetical protein